MSVLVVGSCTVDNLVYVDHLPQSQDSLKANRSEFRLGGCAYNVAHATSNCTFVSTCGKGIYADYIRYHLMEEEFEVCLPFSNRENGYCICLIEPNGERSFIAYRGVEHTYDVDALFDLDEYDYTYVCGMELEEDASIFEYLEKVNTQLFFACGPRLKYIKRERLDKMLSLHPILHMSCKELLDWTNMGIEDGIKYLYSMTSNLVIVTDGSNGSYAYDGCMHFVASKPVECTNSVGAGDHHAGICLACLDDKLDVDCMLEKANESCGEMLVKN